MTMTRLRPSEASPRSRATSASLDTVSARRAILTSGCPWPQRVAASGGSHRRDGGNLMGSVATGVFSFRMALNFDFHDVQNAHRYGVGPLTGQVTSRADGRPFVRLANVNRLAMVVAKGVHTPLRGRPHPAFRVGVCERLLQSRPERLHVRRRKRVLTRDLRPRAISGAGITRHRGPRSCRSPKPLASGR
jgi:hypothetical protein